MNVREGVGIKMQKDPYMETAEIVIVGGGIAGAALAYFLEQEGVSDVGLLEPG